MCGIAGFTGGPDQSRLKKMTDAITYRGPDAEGFFVNRGINLGHRRLSIIDLASGQQPMTSEDGNTTMVFNGEIYNYLELKKNLHYSFRTTSDTEVLLAFYLEQGLDFLNHLNGMFAFALWDNHQQKLLLARDRMGKKPLYYAVIGKILVFASEPKAILASSFIKSELDLYSLQLYLHFQYIPGDCSIFSGIRKLPAGHYLVWQNGSVTIKPYWRASFSDTSKPDIQELDRLLDDAVRKRLIADVPLGVFLSGGIDSSTITYYAAKNSSIPIQTFSIGFEEQSFDESTYCNLVAKALSTDHHHTVFSTHEMLDAIPSALALSDEPFADASMLPTYLLSKFTRQQVTVALGGDGSDELFAGYPTFLAHRIADMYGYVPRFFDKIALTGASRVPVSHRNIPFNVKIAQALKGARQEGPARDALWMSAFDPIEQQRLLDPGIYSQTNHEYMLQNIEEVLGGSSSEAMNRVLEYWQQGYLVDDILYKVDRASMYNALEVRAPFLDYRIVEWVNNLPYKQKFRGRTTKYLLKQLMKDKLPSVVVTRPKKGFGVPLSQWLCNELKEFMQESLSVSSLRSIGLFQEHEVRRLVDEHLTKSRDHRLKLWTLIVFVQWHRRWISH